MDKLIGRLARLCIVKLLLIAGFSYAEDSQSLGFVLDSPSGVYRQITDLSTDKITRITVSSKTDLPSFYKSLLVNDPAIVGQQLVTIGVQSADKIFQQKKNLVSTPILSALLTGSAFNTLANKHFGSVEQALAKNVSVILLDQSVQRYITLGLSLVPSAKSVGVLLGPSNLHKKDEFEKWGLALGVTLRFAEISADENPIKIIDPIIASTDFFIVIPDRQLINRAAAKWVLQLSYRHQKPVIAYSRKYVQAGALAAVYSSPENIASQIADVVNCQCPDEDGRGQIYYPQYFSIQLNSSVARSLNYTLKETASYHQDVLNSEINK